MLNTKEKINTNIFVGQGVTYSIGSDSYAMTVIKYENNVVSVQHDKDIPTNNHDVYGEQKNLYVPDENGRIEHYKQYNWYDGPRWFKVKYNSKTKRWIKNNIFGRHPATIHFGFRRTYRDPSF